MPRRLPSEFTRLLAPLRRPWAVAGLLGLIGYGCFCGYHGRIVPGGSDSSGYFNLARALVAGRIDQPARPLEGIPASEAPPFAYAPLGFRPSEQRAELTPTYPIGLPGLLALAGEVFGWSVGPRLLFALLAAAGLGLTYALARQAGLGAKTAALAALALGLCPLYLRYSLVAMSDLPALVAGAASLGLALRPSLRAAGAAGVAAGIAVLIRPSNAVLILPLILALGTDWRRLLGAAAGGAPLAVILALFNKAAYGSMLSTGYGDVSSAFSRGVVAATLEHYATWLPLLLSPFVAFAVAAPLAGRSRRRLVAAHASWVLITGTFYAFYYHTHEAWWYLRFLLPVFPSLVVLASLGGEALLARLERTVIRRAFQAGAAGVVITSSLFSLRELEVVRGVREEDAYPQGVALVRTELPTRAVILAMQHSGSLYFGTSQVIVRWEMLEGQWPRFRDAARQAGRPVYALLFDFELTALQEQVPGAWRPLRRGPNLHLFLLEPGVAP